MEQTEKEKAFTVASIQLKIEYEKEEQERLKRESGR